MLSSLFICYFNYFNSSSICLLSLAQLSRIFISVYPSICWFIHLYYYIKVHLSIHLDWHSWLLCLSLFGYALLELFIFWKTQVCNIFIIFSERNLLHVFVFLWIKFFLFYHLISSFFQATHQILITVRKVFDMTRAFDCIQTLYLDEDKDFQNYICTEWRNGYI